MWWWALVGALQDALNHIDPRRIASICISHQRETFVPTDKDGIPLRNAILWMDERAGEYLSYFDEVLGRDRYHQITGKPLSGNLSAVKIAWLKENEPKLYERTDKFLDVHAFLVYQLTGQFYTGLGCADPTGLYDMEEYQWSAEILKRLGLSDQHFPSTVPSGHVIGNISINASRDCGLPQGLPIMAGIGDGQAAGLGTNATKPGIAYLSLGTSVVSGVISSSYLTSKCFRTMYSGLKDSFYLETVILGGTYTISWFMEKLLSSDFGKVELNPWTEDSLEELAKDIPAGSLGLLLVPYWNSAMNPYWDVSASGIMVGLRGIHGQGHFYRAILEGIAYEQRLHTIGVENALGRNIDQFVVIGGGASSNLWCQIIADVTGKPVQRTIEKEATALGAGILAAYGSGFYANIQNAAQAMVHLESEIFEPDVNKHEMYSEIFEDIYRHIYPVLKDRLRILSKHQ
jgi:xylulokinase